MQDWVLLYSMHMHGSNISTFYAKCRGQQDTLLAVETARGEIFGAS